MKNNILIISFVIAVLFFSCAGFPKPSNEKDSMIIGNFTLSFPDGFFNWDSRVVGSGIQLEFLNTTTNRSVRLKTLNGFFKFATNGTDEYVFKGFKLEQKTDAGTYRIGPAEFNRKIRNQPGKIIYLGHTVIIYAKGKAVNDEYRTDEAASMVKKSYNYDIKIDYYWNQDEIEEYVTKRDKNEVWKEFPIVQAPYMKE